MKFLNTVLWFCFYIILCLVFGHFAFQFWAGTANILNSIFAIILGIIAVSSFITAIRIIGIIK